MRQSLVKLHPHTGVPLAMLGRKKNGQPIWPILGASEDDGDAGDGNTDPEGDGADGDGDEGDSASAGDDNANKDPRIKALSDEAARNRVKAKELAAELEDARKALKVIEDKDKSEVEKLSADVKELQAKHEAAMEQLQQTRLENAFLSSNKFEWHNPDRALKLADLSEVEIDEDGNVTGLDKALEALAKSDPYLIKSKDSDQDDGDGKGGSSGAPVGSGGGSKKKSADRARLEKKYPALRR